MRRFTQLYLELDATTRTTEKVAALEAYFRAVPPDDGAWALWLLTGNRVKRAVSYTKLRALAAETAGIPDWLMAECHSAVGDLSETLSLVLPRPTVEGPGLSLREVFEQVLLPLRRQSDDARASVLRGMWARLDQPEKLVFHKLLSGAFRVGAARTLVVRSAALAAGVSQAGMAARVMGDWPPTRDAYERIMAPPGAPGQDARPANDAQPFPFFLAQQLGEELGSDPEPVLGERTRWQVEVKWDGIRAQLIRRAGGVFLWSRGEEPIGANFPEVTAGAADLPLGTVLDGEVLAWEADGPMPFAQLQTRINRPQRDGLLFPETPVCFMAYDLLELGGADIRAQPQSARRALLEGVLRGAGPVFRLSPLLSEASWAELAAVRAASRERGVEGLMLKRLDAPYGSGRSGDAWWKWKIEPHVVDCVLVAAEPGSGRRAGLLTDYTFAVRDAADGQLVTVAKAYSGLTDDEIKRVDRWIRDHTTGTFGPVRAVKPELVFEIAFEAIARSDRHKAGVALRFPRMRRWRTDKPAAEIDTLQRLEAMLPAGLPARPRRGRARSGSGRRSPPGGGGGGP